MSSLNPAIACVLAALIGYLLGCPNLANVIARKKGVDLRRTGTKNLGTSNTFVTFGFFWAALVFLHDAGKAFIAIHLCRLLFPQIPLTFYAAGAGAVFGHVYPFHMGFRGGKGFAAYLGMILGIDWRLGILVCAGVILVMLIANHFIVASALTTLFFPIWTAVTGKGLFAVLLASAASLLYLILHKENFVRLFSGTEPKLLPFKRKKSPPEEN